MGIRCRAMNIMTHQGMPQSERVAAFNSPGADQREKQTERPVVQRENTRLITGRRRFDSFLADSRRQSGPKF